MRNQNKLLVILFIGLGALTLTASVGHAQDFDFFGDDTTGGQPPDNGTDPGVPDLPNNGGNGGGGSGVGGGNLGEIPLPRNNVTGGALSERRPGTWVSSAIGRHNERITRALQSFGGATIRGEEELEPEPRDRFTTAIIDSLLQSLDSFVNIFALAVEAGSAT
jgi:hypothetical protein